MNSSPFAAPTVAGSRDNTSRNITNEFQDKAYAATIAITTTKNRTLVRVAQLTGALTVTCGVGSSTLPPVIGDRVTFLFSADGTNRVVTFSTGLQSSGTLTVTASKYGSAEFMFNGTTWVEVSRAVTA